MNLILPALALIALPQVSTVRVDDLRAVNGTTSSVTLSWTAPTDPSGTAAAQYDLRWSDRGPIRSGAEFEGSPQVVIEAAPASPGTTETFTVGGLVTGEDGYYWFALRVMDFGQAWGPISNPAAFTTNDLVAPSDVTDLSWSPAGTGTIRLAWTAPGNDGSAGQAERYEIRFAYSPLDAAAWDDAAILVEAPSPLSAGTAESLVIAGLPADVDIHIAIRATDGYWWSGLSNGIVARAPAPPAAPPPGPDERSGGDGCGGSAAAPLAAAGFLPILLLLRRTPR